MTEVSRRSFFALASGLLVPERVYSFVGGWSLPLAFVELTDGRILTMVEMPAVVTADRVVRPRAMAHMGGAILSDVAHPAFFVVDAGGNLMGHAGNKPRETYDLTPQIVRARCGDLESWWENGKRLSSTGRHNYPSPELMPMGYL